MIQLKALFKLAPALAIKYFKKKNNKLSWDWYELWQDAHQKSFTVAKAMREDILKDIRSSLDKASSRLSWIYSSGMRGWTAFQRLNYNGSQCCCSGFNGDGFYGAVGFMDRDECGECCNVGDFCHQGHASRCCNGNYVVFLSNEFYQWP